MGAVPKSVPTAVAPSAGNSVKINERPQRGPYKPMSGSSYVPYVPGGEGSQDVRPQPGYGGAGSSGSGPDTGTGAPSVPAMGGALFTPGPIDAHYQSQVQAANPYAVNRPRAPGLFTFVKAYANGIFLGKQNVGSTGWQTRQQQQRTSYMRITPPAHGAGYAPETFTPRQLPQRGQTYQYNPVTGNDQPGPGILNRTTYGAGQTAGGVGGNQYTPSPGPPATTSTAGAAANPSGMPVWG
jgi:hypothetical protein